MSDINVDTPGASGANPTATASDVAVNGSAATFMRSDGAPAVQKTSSSVFGLCKVDGSTITASGGVITAVPGGGGVGNVTGPASSTDTAIATWNGTAGTALRNNSATLIDASGNISTTGKFSAIGNVSGGNLTTAGLVSATGNVTGGNLTTAGVVSATGNVSGGNLTTAGNVTGSNIGNITPINLDGNNTHVLLGNGTFGASPGGSGALTLITETITSGSQGNVTFSSIANTYRTLEILIDARGTASTDTVALVLQFNSDTGSNYYTDRENQFGANFSSSTGITVAEIPAATTAANLTSGAFVQIPNYKGTTFYKRMWARSDLIIPGIGLTESEVGWWLNTAAVTDIKIFPTSGNITDGSLFSLYGRM